MVREMLFPDGEIRTDSLLYREKCHLLLPDPFTQNLFYSISDELQTRFFVASDSNVNLDRLKSFFQRLYGVNFEGVEQVADPGEYTAILNLKSPLLREREFYYPGFVRNILDFNSVDRDSTIRYAVSIRSGDRIMSRNRSYGMSISVSFSSENSGRRLSPLISQEQRKLKQETGMKLKNMRGRRMSDVSLKVPFNLINFIRVPAESDLST